MNYTFQELINDFLLNQDVNDISRKSYEYWLRPFHRWVVNNQIDVVAIERPEIIAYKKYLTQRYTDKTVNCYLTGIRLFYTWCIDNGYINYNPTKGIKMRNLDKRHRKLPLTDEQVSTLLKSCDWHTITGIRAYLIIRLMLVTGLRAVEVSRLEVTDLHRDGISVQGKGRTDKDAFIPVPIELIVNLRKIKGERYLFETVRRKQLHSTYISEIINNQMQRAGIKSNMISTHSLRHTAAVTAMKMTNNNIYEVQQLLRHTSTKTTEIYIKTISGQHNNVSTIVRRMDERLGNRTEQSETNNIPAKQQQVTNLVMD